MLNALSIDVEDYYQVEAFASVVDRSQWDTFPSRVTANTERLLALLERRRVRATWFVLGWTAQRFPELVRRIHDAGHELATHGFWHRLVYRQSPEEFVEDVRCSLAALSAAVPDAMILGYRAPSFSITQQSAWALEILAANGLRYDSSIVPIAGHDLYGVPSAPRVAHRLDVGIWEIPVSTVRCMGRNWPAGGGGYFRLLPYRITRWAIRRLNREGHPAVMYLHPWEIDPEQPHIAGASFRSRVRHYLNLTKTEPRLERMLDDFRFAPISTVFAAQLASAPTATPD